MLCTCFIWVGIISISSSVQSSELLLVALFDEVVRSVEIQYPSHESVVQVPGDTFSFVLYRSNSSTQQCLGKIVGSFVGTTGFAIDMIPNRNRTSLFHS